MGGFDYPEEFFYEAEMFPEATDMSILGVFVVVYFLFLFLMMAYSMVSYVLHSLGLYTIAERRGIRHSWLAWVPGGNIWILGSISDQYQYVAKGKVKNRRKLLLGLAIGLIVVYVGWIVAMMLSLILSEGIASGAAAAVILAVLGALAIVALAILALVYEYMCLYDLYHSCNPGNATAFLVLSILFTVTMPFFVFACRKKDLGMPPRKQPVPQPVIEVVQEEPVTEEGFAQPEEFEE